MKTAQGYLDAAFDAAEYSYPIGECDVPVALAAIQAALDDAAKEADNREKYKNLLAVAIINAQPQTQ